VLEISADDIKRNIGFQNPWWEEGKIDDFIDKYPRRAYLDLFYKLLKEKNVNRAVVLMGQRRIGKTVMIYHAIQNLLNEGVKPDKIIYFSIETPNFLNIPLLKLIELALGKDLKRGAKGYYIFFDEVQYLKQWEVHLKSLVDQYPKIKFVASGSAGAALKLKSSESGAGRFTDFLLPPLSFYEFIKFVGAEKLIEKPKNIKKKDIENLNVQFVNYINYGGYPEAIFSKDIQKDTGRYIRSDIIDKVLLRDLPSLYGIKDVQELNRLFTMLAYNTGNEVSLDQLSKKSGVTKPTIKRYIEYLEAAFLIKIMPRVDENARRFKRASRYKVYLTNPSMRCALFGAVEQNDEAMGYLTETAVYSQFLHSSAVHAIHYARWGKGEIDLVFCFGSKPAGLIEVKWSDNLPKKSDVQKKVIGFARKHSLIMTVITTRNLFDILERDSTKINLVPSSYFCFVIGKDIFAGKSFKDYLPIENDKKMKKWKKV